MVIQELIVVEGKNDAHAVRRALGDVDILWTNGLGLTEEKLKLIEAMAKRRGVIVCTDPDYPGKQIRERINQRVPNVKHVYVSRNSALNKKGDDIGLENVSPEEIRLAFSKILDESKSAYFSEEISENQLLKEQDTITMQDLIEHGLTGQAGASAKRLAVGKILGIGDTNTKQFLHRIRRFGFSRQEFFDALSKVDSE